jgi:Mrp family chromosome partitioning ATPase
MSGLFDALVRASASARHPPASPALDIRCPGDRDVPRAVDDDPYDGVRRALALESGGRLGRLVMVLSTLPGEGVTTVTRGLGAVLAREGRLVVADVAAERARFLAGAGARGDGDDWAEAFRRALPLLRARVDRLLLDGGALETTPELLTLAPHVDTVVLVVAAQHAPIREVRRTRRRLEQAGAPIAGVVLTGYHEHVPRALRGRRAPAVIGP